MLASIYALKSTASSPQLASPFNIQVHTLRCGLLHSLNIRTETMSTPTKETSMDQKQDHNISAYADEKQVAGGVPSFKWSHLWQQPIINTVNLKSYTLPILNLNNPYSRSFHLSWRESLLFDC